MPRLEHHAAGLPTLSVLAMLRYATTEKHVRLAPPTVRTDS